MGDGPGGGIRQRAPEHLSVEVAVPTVSRANVQRCKAMAAMAASPRAVELRKGCGRSHHFPGKNHRSVGQDGFSEASRRYKSVHSILICLVHLSDSKF